MNEVSKAIFTSIVEFKRGENVIRNNVEREVWLKIWTSQMPDWMVVRGVIEGAKSNLKDDEGGR